MQHTFIALNAIRALSVVALLLVFSSSIFVMVTDVRAVNDFVSARQSGNTTMDFDYDYIEGSTVPNQPAGAFWAVLNRLLIIFQTIILLFAEVEWPMFFFDRFIPVLGSEFGLGALGIFQALIGTAILSHHVDKFSLVSAFFLFALGCVNMFLGLIYRESAKDKRALSSWRSETKSVLPTHNAKFSSSSSFLSRSYQDEKRPESNEFGVDHGSVKGYGFGRQGEKQAGLKGFILKTPEETLPRYAPKNSSSRPVSIRSGTSESSSAAGSAHHSQHSSHSRESSVSSHTDVDAEHEHEDAGRISHTHSRSATPVPTFKSSATAL
ncbi:hypothetical protein HWV62_26416 [Athelia sp. TMB]|nr:hypothetical protein HWV62_26416 [Athelia sp. TMB]